LNNQLIEKEEAEITEHPCQILFEKGKVTNIQSDLDRLKVTM
jgi:hypothetical protein